MAGEQASMMISPTTTGHGTLPAGGGRSLSPWLLACLALFAIVHGALLAYDMRNPEAFYGGDRGDKRANKIYVFLDIPDMRKVSSPTWSSIPAQPFGSTVPKLSTTEKLLNLGPPGDYLVHAVPYRLGGSFAVIAVQLVLGLLAVICVFRLGERLGLTSAYAFVATALYLLLPGALYQAHQLVTEGLFNPLLAIVTFLLVRTVEEPLRWRVFLSALVLLALAMEIRTQLLLYPLVLVAIFVAWQRHRWTKLVIPTLVICFAIPVAWSIFVSLQPPDLVITPTELSPLRNLSGIVERMAIRGGFPFDRAAYPGEQIPIWDFLGYVVRYPIAFLEAKVTDVVEVVLNPGITGFGKYLGLDLFTFRTESGRLFWSQVKWNAGVVGVVRELWRQDLAFLLPFLAACAVWALILAFALWGVWCMLRDRRIGAAAKAILISVVVYNLAIVQVGEMTRVTHRSPVEFIIAIWFAMGLSRLLRRTDPATATDRSAYGNGGYHQPIR
ncbi:MAG: glycosyltransferase family 39 protein [Rhodospirillales bacterium]